MRGLPGESAGSPHILSLEAVMFDQFRLEEDLPFIRPESELGELAINLAGAFSMYATEMNQRQVFTDETGIGREELERTKENHQSAWLRICIFYDIYRGVEPLLDARPAERSAEVRAEMLAVARRMALVRALAGGAETVEPNLRDFIDEITLLYWQEIAPSDLIAAHQ